MSMGLNRRNQRSLKSLVPTKMSQGKTSFPVESKVMERILFHISIKNLSTFNILLEIALSEFYFTFGLSFSAKYTRLENVKTATPTRSISKPSSL